MTTLNNRLTALEKRLGPPECRCGAGLRFLKADGSEHEPTLPSTCPHGNKWRMIREYIGVDPILV